MEKPPALADLPPKARGASPRRRQLASAMDVAASLASTASDNYHERLGITIVRSERGRVVGEMAAGPEHVDQHGLVRSAALLVFADQLASHGAALGVQQDQVVLTLETKANYFRRCKSTVLGGESTPLHIGPSTMVWQTALYESGGNPIAMISHTLLVLAAEGAAAEEAAHMVAAHLNMQPRAAGEAKRTAVGRSRQSSDIAVAKRREHIAEAACKVISRKGFATSTIREIADEAGLHVPTLYQYVSSKDEVLELVFKWLVDQVGMDLEVATHDCETAHEKLVSAIRILLSRSNLNRAQTGVLNRELNSLSPKARLRVLSDIQTLMGQIAVIVHEGVASGEFRAVEPLMTANFIDAVVDVWALRQFSVRRFGLKEFENEVLRFFEAAVLRRD